MSPGSLVLETKQNLLLKSFSVTFKFISDRHFTEFKCRKHKRGPDHFEIRLFSFVFSTHPPYCRVDGKDLFKVPLRYYFGAFFLKNIVLEETPSIL